MAAAVKELVSGDHADTLFTTLQELYHRHLLTDVALVCGPLEFTAHMTVLAAYSPLFKDMLNRGTFNGYYRHMVKNSNTTCLELLLEFLYSGCLKLTPSLAPLMHATALELQIQSAVDLCQQYMAENKEETPDSLFQDMTSAFDGETLSEFNIKSEADPQDLAEESAEDVKYSDTQDPTWGPGSSVTFTPAQGQMQRSKTSPKKQKKTKPKPKHGCPKCRKKFMHHSSMTLHLRMHTGGVAVAVDLRNTRTFHRQYLPGVLQQEQGASRFLCQICDKRFSLYTLLKKHHTKCHVTGRQCKRCSEKFPSRKLLLLHGFKKHGLKQRVKTRDALLRKCQHCSRTFLHKANYAKHVAVIHPRNKRKSRPREYKCPHCKGTYKYERNFQKHLQQHDQVKREQTEGICMKKKVNYKPKKYKCEECQTVLKCHRDAVSHMKDAHSSISYPCRLCSWQTPFRKALVKHMKAKHGEDSWIRTCDMCGKVFNKKRHLVGHKFSMHGIHHPSLKLITCTVGDCNYVTYYPSLLAQHMRMHSGPKRYKCEFCHKDFRTQGSLKHHIDILHLNIRPCICELCGASFGSEYELASHTATHSESKRFKCSWCDYAAKQKINLRNHTFLKHNLILDHKTKVLQCEKCGFQTVQQNRFNAHVEQHAELRTIPCKSCDKLFRSHAGLRSHVETIHRPKSLKCDFCKYRTALNKVLQKHIRVVHTHPHYKPYKCGYCEFVCATSQNCRKHVMQRHKNLEVKWVRIGPTKPE